MKEVWPLVTSKVMAALDAATVSRHGVPAELLMECAGFVVADCAQAGLDSNGTVLVVTGGGNNGGDGWVAARHLHLRGVPVTVLDLAEDDRARSALTRLNRERALSLGVTLGTGRGLPRARLIIDCLLGTGSSRKLEGRYARVVSAINRSGPDTRVLSVDLPSGIHGDTGELLGTAVRADETLCLGLPKLGIALLPGREFAGRVRVANIGIETAVEGERPDGQMLTHRGAALRLPSRPRDGHKGTFGHVLVLGGSRGKAGAAVLAARGAFGIGAGLVTVACAESSAGVVTSNCCEAMTLPLAESPTGEPTPDALQLLLGEANRFDALVVGPGLGRGPDTAVGVQQIARGLRGPAVFDADALHALAADPSVLDAGRAPRVVTPHPGEAATMLGRDTAQIARERLGSVRELAQRFSAVAVLKGAPSVICDAESPLWVNSTGGPNLATGGSGDVLAGIIAGLLAQGSDALTAAAVAVHVHGLTGDRLATRRGPAGTRSGEIADALPETLAWLHGRAERDAGEGDTGVLAFPEP